METECQCSSVYTTVDEVIARKGADPDSLIEVLHGVQEQIGYLPQVVQEYVAERLGIAPGTVESVVSFYSFFTSVPRGRHVVKVCQGTACYVRGGKQLLAAVEHQCGCSVGSTSENMRFSVDIVRCVGACGLSPVMTVDDDTHDRVRPTKVADILSQYE